MNILRNLRKLERILTSKFNKLSFVVAGFCLFFGMTFGLFIVTTGKYKASEMYIGNLMYTMNLRVVENSEAVSGNTVTIPDEYTYTVMVDIGSLNPIRSKYKLQYKTNCTECQVFISDVTGWNYSGSINPKEVDIDKKTVKVIIINTSGASATVDFGVTGGYNYNTVNSIAKLDGYSEKFKTNYVDSSSSKILKEIVKDDTECTPTESEPCYYGGEEKRNYITNNDRIYRILGVYMEEDVEYVKMIDIAYDQNSSYSSLETSLQTYSNALPNNKLDYLTGNVSLLTTTDYIKTGSVDSYLNRGVENLTQTLQSSEVYYIDANGEIKLKGLVEDSKINPVLTLKTLAKVKSKGLGTINNPYVIFDSISDIIISEIKVDGGYVTEMPATGVFDLTSSCTGGSARWVDMTSMVEFDITTSPITCSLNFTKRDMKYSIKVDGVLSTIPTSGNYTMNYKCYNGNAVLTWDNTNYTIDVSNIVSPLYCNIEFTSVS